MFGNEASLHCNAAEAINPVTPSVTLMASAQRHSGLQRDESTHRCRGSDAKVIAANRDARRR